MTCEWNEIIQTITVCVGALAAIGLVCFIFGYGFYVAIRGN